MREVRLLRRGLGGLLVLGFFSASAASALPSKKESWIELKTPHFTVFSAASRSNTRLVAGNLEQLRQVLGGFAGFDLRSPVPTYVYIFVSEGKLRGYKPLHDGRPTAINGFLLRRDEGSFIALHSDAPDLAGLVGHEYVHDVVGHNFKRLPPWVEEGLAEYYGTFLADGRKCLVGRTDGEHLRWLMQNRLIPLGDLFAVGHGSPEYNEGSQRGGFYAESWALVHYLLNDEERRHRLLAYIDLLGQGRRHAEAFAEAFAVGTDALEGELRAYVRGGPLPVATLTIEPPADDAFVERPMGYGEVLFRLAELLAQQEEHAAEAEKHYRRALQELPEDGRVLSGLGRLAGLRGEDDEALRLLGRAVESTASDPAAGDPAGGDPLVHYRYGEVLASDRDDAARLERARSAFRHAVELSPGFAPAWAKLAYVATFAAEVTDDDVAAGETARRLLPSRDDVASHLLVLYAKRGMHEAAARLYDEHLSGAVNAEDRHQALAVLAALELREAQRLTNAGRGEEALAVLAGLERRVQGTEEATDTRPKIELLRMTIERNRLAERFNEAVELYNSLQLDAALERLETLLRELPEGDLKRRTQELVDDIRSHKR